MALSGEPGTWRFCPRLCRCFDLGADHKEHLALGKRRLVLDEVVDRVRELRPGDVVTAALADAGVVEPDAIAVISDDEHEMRNRPALLLEVIVVSGVVRVAESMR